MHSPDASLAHGLLVLCAMLALAAVVLVPGLLATLRYHSSATTTEPSSSQGQHPATDVSTDVGGGLTYAEWQASSACRAVEGASPALVASILTTPGIVR